MNDQLKLLSLIRNAQKPTIIEWVYNVEAFLKEINEYNQEAEELIRHIKVNRNSFGRCENLIAFLKQIYQRKKSTVILPQISKRNQIFVAMMFSKDKKVYYDEAYKPVICSLNYASMRIDEKEYNGSIIGEIVKEIPDSVALIADLTGNRGGVYYEAGIARGLQLCNHPIKLILTCSKEFFDKEKVHFDVSGDNIILYDSIEDLKNKLRSRLEVVLNND